MDQISAFRVAQRTAYSKDSEESISPGDGAEAASTGQRATPDGQRRLDEDRGRESLGH